MKLIFSSTFLFTLAVATAQEKAQSLRKLQQSEPINFQGDGCMSYDPSDSDWVTLPYDDDYDHLVAMGFPFTFGATTYTDILINSNGHLHFDFGSSDEWHYAADGFVSASDISIAPFQADVNNVVTGHIRYKLAGDNVAVVWEEVGHYLGTADNTNSFEVVLSSNGSNDPKICFCYDKMGWALDGNSPQLPGEVGISIGSGSGFLLGDFSQTDATWNGIGSSDNGVGYLTGKSFCFNPDIVNSSNPSKEIISTFGPGTGGDPHFKTWHNEHYQYHGQCDLVLAKDATFANGLGLDIHIRTKLVRHWSYIKTAAIRIGNDILEIEGSGKGLDKEVRYWFNYEYQGDLTEFAGFPVTIKADGSKLQKNRIDIDLSSKYPGQKVTISSFKEFVKVDFTNPTSKAFGNTVGMLGDFESGKTLARDGATVLDDYTDLGREWQVLPTDAMLFHESSSAPQFPELCIEPEDPRGDRARRLGESSITEEQAEAACARLKDGLDRKDCIYDIISTEDMDMVGAY
ncbi:unnamed protein product [Cylindrotheca closterium]|uniref:VWFD domain-containing protein n=1 Tax=Cylindrotheca closterium TaxID=2856 RepID=A0AAD2G215_9STRA|nr:unnamed protein product [Cylindrotheca closterium]